MPNENIEMLETIITVMLNSKFKGSIPKEEDIIERANEARQLCAISDEEFEQVIKNIHASSRVTMNKGVFIVDDELKYQSWFPSRRGEIDFYYWLRFKKYLETEKGWNVRVISKLDEVTDDIIDLLGDPRDERPWKRRGLILGDVQSGKTINYTAICNKAADAGYKVIILLTGTLENLRKQTQARLDSDFVGVRSGNVLQKDIQTIFEGVGKINRNRRAWTFTSDKNDFKMQVVDNVGLSLENCPEPALFVVKKNKNILQNLEKWLRMNNANNSGVIDLPMLLIDDEADNASVNTKDDNNPTAINDAIRKLLHLFNRDVYLGVTATPFANIFINPDNSDDMLEDDLFPRDFIYSLSPPSNYIGSNTIFDETSKYHNNLIEIDDAEKSFPAGHKSDYTVEMIPTSLEESITYFVLTNAVRDFRGHQNTHRSMLVNVSRFTAIQDQVAEHISFWLQRVRTDIQNYSKLSFEEACKSSTIHNLFKVWNKYKFGAMSGVEWSLIQNEYLINAIMPINVRAVNQRTGAKSLDYDAHRETGFRVIAVGGNSLSRGLTLEGLCVSYFYRNSQMYDTLMQMGRWFGYRPGYDDLFRVWMTVDTMDWYAHITAATNELKDDIRRMNRQGLTPKDFGLKVREHPDSLIPTAKNKMRNGTSIERWISVNGRLLETPRLKAKIDDLKINERLFRSFIYELDKLGKREQKIGRNETLWTNVPKEAVVDLVRNFITHPWHMAFQSGALADFIELSTHLSHWDVVIPNGSGDIKEFEGVNEKITVHLQKRAFIVKEGAYLISGTKVRVGSGGCTKAGLTEEEIDKAKAEFYANNCEDKSPSDDAYLLEGRKPLLLLHVIQPNNKDNQGLKAYEMGEVIPVALGLGFPRYKGHSGNEKVKYIINPVEFKNWFTLEEDDDIDVED